VERIHALSDRCARGDAQGGDSSRKEVQATTTVVIIAVFIFEFISSW